MSYFEMDNAEIEKHINTLMRFFPQEAKKAVAKFLNDQARLYKDLAPKILGTRYTIRNKAFVNRQFKVTRAKTTSPVDRMIAEAYTEAYPRFTGWEEEITGERREMRSSGAGKHPRLIWNTARGGSHESQVKGQYRLRSGGEGYNSDIISNSANYGMPIPQFLAMLSKSPVDASGNKRIGKNKVFILDGPGYPKGLYRIKDGEGTSMPEIEALQEFREHAPNAEKFDWQEETTKKVKFWYPPAEIFKIYLLPIFEKLWK